MTPERLARFAEMVNGRFQQTGGWGAGTNHGWPLDIQKIITFERFEDGGTTTYFDAAADVVSYDPTRCDLANSAFVIWGLDRLEEMGWNPELRHKYHRDDDDVEGALDYVIILRRMVGDDWGYETSHATGKTRAEAVFNALYTTLEASK